MVAFVLYALIASHKEGSRVQQAVDKASDTLTAQNAFDLEGYSSKIFPAQPAALRSLDLTDGTGSFAACGQEVKISYEATLPDGTVVDKMDKTAPLSLRIGGGKAMPVFEQGILGMQVGGTRSLIAPPSMAYEANGFHREGIPPNASVKFNVELLEASPELPDIRDIPYRIMDTRPGSGPAVECGKPVSLHVTVWSADGKKLFSSKEESRPVILTPGASEAFLGLDQGILGMPLDGARTLIVPPPLQKTMNGNPPKIDFHLPARQTVIIDIEPAP